MLRRITIAACLLLLAGGTARADWVTKTVTVGTSPHAMAVNPVTNKMYIANQSGDSVTVINGATNDTSQILNVLNPYALAVNPVTNRIYVVNKSANTVTVIDGTNDEVLGGPINVGSWPEAIAVNPVTNKVYVAIGYKDSVTVIYSDDTPPKAVKVGANPYAIAVNPVTNKIYVGCVGSDEVSEIDGVGDNVTATIQVLESPFSIAVNPVTNRIYVTNSYSKKVTVINGTNNDTTQIRVGSWPAALAVNPVTNKTYVANADTAADGKYYVTVIDGEGNLPTMVQTGRKPRGIAVNPVTNRIYVANNGDNTATVIDGSDDYTTTTVEVGGKPSGVVVNPVTGKVYVSNTDGNSVTVINGEPNDTALVTAGTSPYAAAVNPVTNKIYVANYGNRTVTVMDGADNSKVTVAAGNGPRAVAVNPVTNRAYVANDSSNNVTVIYGANDSTKTVATGNGPRAVAVNPVTNKIYVTNYLSNTVTVIDGATNGTSTVSVSTNPIAVAVNPVTNKIYVANYGGYSVTVIRGSDNSVIKIVTVGGNPRAVAVNPVTNRIYVANYAGGVTVINGETDNVITTVLAATRPFAVAVNPVINKVYATNLGSRNVTVIDGANNTSTVAAGEAPYAVAVNLVTNRVYVANDSNAIVTVIDGATNATTSVAAGTGPRAVAVNPVNGKVYCANSGSGNVTVIEPAPINDTKVTAWLQPDPDHQTLARRPSLSGKAENAQGPGTAMFKAFTLQGTAETGWEEAATVSGEGTSLLTWKWMWGTADSLHWGENLLCVLPLDLSTGTTNNLGLGTPYTGNRLVYPIYRIGAPASTEGVDVALVIDRSASMEYYEYMVPAQAAAAMFVDLMENGDGIAVVSYSNTATVEFAMATVSDANREAAQAAVWAITPAGLTSIGAGMLKGQDELDKAGFNTSKTMVLLSDGYQTTEPWVKDVLPDIVDAGTPVYTIALGDDVDEELLQHIAAETEGEYYNTPDGGDLREIYSLIRSKLAGGQMVASIPGRLAPGETALHSAQLDRLMTAGSFLLIYPTGNEAQPVRMGLELVTPSGLVIDSVTPDTAFGVSLVRRPGYDYFRVDSPAPGTWKLRVVGDNLPGEQTYTAMVQGVSELVMDARLGRSRPEVGQPVLLQARITDKGRPVSRASVSARITYPRAGGARAQKPDQAREVGASDQRPSTRPNSPTAGPGPGAYKSESAKPADGQPGNAAGRAGLSAGGPRAAFGLSGPERTADTIMLHDDGLHGDSLPGDGIYGAYYHGAALPGSYGIELLADGTGPAAGAFERFAGFSSYVGASSRPYAPLPAAPANGADSVPTSAMLVWHRSSRAQTYRVQVSDCIGFSTAIADTAGIADTLRQVTGLAPGTVYYWRVMAESSGRASDWSPEWWFATVAEEPEEDMAISPNPFVPARGHNRLSFFGRELALAELLVYAKDGQLVRTLREEAGLGRVDWEIGDIGLASGVYVCVARRDGKVVARAKFAVIR